MTQAPLPFAVCARGHNRDGRIDSLRYGTEDAALEAARKLAAKHGRPFCVLSVSRVVHPPEQGGDLFDR